MQEGWLFTKSLDILLAVAHIAEFLKPAHWFKQIKRTVSFDVTTRFNPIQQSTAAYNSHLFNGRNTTINYHILSIQRFCYYPCVRHIFTVITCTVKVPIVIYYKSACSFPLFSLRKCMELHHFIS